MKPQIRWMLTLAVLAVLVSPAITRAHCEIPCGIYDDQTRLTLLEEHITTIEKSMRSIEQLSTEGEINYDQLERWISNKEAHADKFMEIVTQYFMTQRVKPTDEADGQAYDDYLRQVTLLHRMLVSAMKCKQTTDLAHPADLTELLTKFREAYLKDR